MQGETKTVKLDLQVETHAPEIGCNDSHIGFVLNEVSKRPLEYVDLRLVAM